MLPNVTTLAEHRNVRKRKRSSTHRSKSQEEESLLCSNTTSEKRAFVISQGVNIETWLKMDETDLGPLFILPKRVMVPVKQSGFSLFSKLFQKTNNTLPWAKLGERSKSVAAAWKNLDEKQKEEYKAKAKSKTEDVIRNKQLSKPKMHSIIRNGFIVYLYENMKDFLLSGTSCEKRLRFLSMLNKKFIKLKPEEKKKYMFMSDLVSSKIQKYQYFVERHYRDGRDGWSPSTASFTSLEALNAEYRHQLMFSGSANKFLMWMLKASGFLQHYLRSNELVQIVQEFLEPNPKFSL